jgi:hypothetical protein
LLNNNIRYGYDFYDISSSKFDLWFALFPESQIISGFCMLQPVKSYEMVPDSIYVIMKLFLMKIILEPLLKIIFCLRSRNPLLILWKKEKIILVECGVSM